MRSCFTQLSYGRGRGRRRHLCWRGPREDIRVNPLYHRPSERGLGLLCDAVYTRAHAYFWTDEKGAARSSV